MCTCIYIIRCGCGCVSVFVCVSVLCLCLCMCAEYMRVCLYVSVQFCIHQFFVSKDLPHTVAEKVQPHDSQPLIPCKYSAEPRRWGAHHRDQRVWSGWYTSILPFSRKFLIQYPSWACVSLSTLTTSFSHHMLHRGDLPIPVGITIESYSSAGSTQSVPSTSTTECDMEKLTTANRPAKTAVDGILRAWLTWSYTWNAV